MEADGAPGAAGKFATTDWRSGRVRRVTHGSYGCETAATVEAAEAGLNIAALVSEYFNGPEMSLSAKANAKRGGFVNREVQIPVEIHTDSDGLVKALENEKIDSGLAPARKRDIALLKECIELGEISSVLHIDGKYNPTDCLTKDLSLTGQTRKVLLDILRTGIYNPVFKKSK